MNTSSPDTSDEAVWMSQPGVPERLPRDNDIICLTSAEICKLDTFGNVAGNKLPVLTVNTKSPASD